MTLLAWVCLTFLVCIAHLLKSWFKTVNTFIHVRITWRLVRGLLARQEAWEYSCVPLFYVQCIFFFRFPTRIWQDWHPEYSSALKIPSHFNIAQCNECLRVHLLQYGIKLLRALRLCQGCVRAVRVLLAPLNGGPVNRQQHKFRCFLRGSPTSPSEQRTMGEWIHICLCKYATKDGSSYIRPNGKAKCPADTGLSLAGVLPGGIDIVPYDALHCNKAAMIVDDLKTKALNP